MEPGGDLDAGTVAVLFLDPVDEADQPEAPALVTGEGATDGAAAGENAATGAQASGTYEYEDRPAAVVVLPSDADPSAVRLQ